MAEERPSGHVMPEISLDLAEVGIHSRCSFALIVDQGGCSQSSAHLLIFDNSTSNMSDRFADSPLDDSIPVSDRPDSTSATTNHGTLSSFTRDKRDGVGYIDDEVHPEVEAQAVELARVAINAIPLDDETEMVEGAGVSHDVSAGEGEAEYEDAEMEEIDEEMVDEQDDYSDHYEDDDDVEYGVEDEDWEVADAGECIPLSLEC